MDHYFTYINKFNQDILNIQIHVPEKFKNISIILKMNI